MSFDGEVEGWLRDFQERVLVGLERLDGAAPFRRDPWLREPSEGHGGLVGSGVTAVIEGGALFERGGVSFSRVEGAALPPSASAHRPELAGRPWRAMGVSLVLHPRNPYVPTTHLNVRLFSTKDGEAWWFGGGFDLTPFYPFDDDVVAWHRAAKAACDPFGPALYPTFKARCDRYFFLKHRDETRGVGGLFFDDLDDRADPTPGDRARCFAFLASVGDAFLPAYAAIVECRRRERYGARERDFQLYRRGRYVEFNLVFDRGTLFGLQSGGRTEAILTSMPPEAKWRYDWQPEPGSPEARLADYLRPRDWLG